MSWRPLDLNDIASEWQDLLDENEEGQITDAELAEEVEKYRDLCDALQIDPNPDALEKCSATLVSEGDFEDFARDQADELGVDRLGEWPYSYIDWERAADALRVDYTTIEYDGDTYYTRDS